MRHVQRNVTRLAAAWACAVGLLAGCGAPTEPTLDDVQLDFYTKVVFGLPSLATRATPGPDEILIEGILLAPNSGYTIGGTVASVPGRLDVFVTARKADPGLPYATQNYYAATLLRLRRGEYPLRVLHVVERERMDTTVVLNRTISVR